jgi:hypothetical protein
MLLTLVPLDTPGLDWKMSSYNHWSRRVIAGSTVRMARAGNNETRGDGGIPRTRG